MRGENDAQLVAKSLHGSEKAFRRLVERHQPMAYSVVRAVLGDRDDVEDVVQEVFVKVFRGLGRFRGDSKFSTWIYRIARNEAISAARRANPHSETLDDTEIRAPETDRPDVQYGREEQHRHVEAYLAQLDENYRVVLELRYMGEKSYAEISELMDVPLGTVKTYVHRAKFLLKEIMSKRTVRGERKKLS